MHAGRARKDPVVQIQMLQATKRARSWWLTVGRGGNCQSCLRATEPGHAIVYRHHGKALHCCECADKLGLAYKVSGTWMRHVAAQRRAA